MDPYTLVTFLFRAPPEVRTVELLGSWDNFTRPYYMHHDRRRGRGFWSGCFNFKNIIFDGDRADWTKPRSGGLKQGGTYWYFYRLNDAIEAFDDSQTYTKGCPLLPGQTVNVMDVPIEVEDLPSRPQSAMVNVTDTLADRTHTLDPDDKWAALDPPPVSRVHERCVSDMALNGRLETNAHSYREAPTMSSSLPVSTEQRPNLTVPRQGSAGDVQPPRSNNGWNSAPPSRGNSSIFEAYEHGAERRSLSAYPIPDVDGRDARPITRSGGSSRHGFDFAFDDSASRRRSMSRTGDDDLDGTSFILEPADSPPHSAYGSVDLRFTITPADYHCTVEHRQNDRPSEDYRRHQRSISDPESLCRLPEDRNAEIDTTGFDMCSPTFSAATISSNGGLNTPFRLSAGYNIGSSASTSANQARSEHGDNGMSTSIEHVTERLRQLGSEDSAGSLPSQVSEEVEERPFVGHYALPIHGAGTESATTLGKVSSGHGSIAHQQDYPPLPTTFGQPSNGDETSFADDIFSELGYLGTSIA